MRGRNSMRSLRMRDPLRDTVRKLAARLGEIASFHNCRAAWIFPESWRFRFSGLSQFEALSLKAFLLNYKEQRMIDAKTDRGKCGARVIAST